MSRNLTLKRNEIRTRTCTPTRNPRRFALRILAGEAAVLQGDRTIRKLSDILIEIAMQGLKSPKQGHSEVMHPLMLLSHVAWNRDTKSSDYLEGRYQRDVAKFSIPKHKLRTKLISDDWSVILERMIEYKQVRFPDDKRVITLCAFTPWDSLRVEWDPDTEQNQPSPADG